MECWCGEGAGARGGRKRGLRRGRRGRGSGPVPSSPPTRRSARPNLQPPPSAADSAVVIPVSAAVADLLLLLQPTMLNLMSFFCVVLSGAGSLCPSVSVSLTLSGFSKSNRSTLKTSECVPLSPSSCLLAPSVQLRTILERVFAGHSRPPLIGTGSCEWR